jgi:hypothetical protein
MYSTIQEAWGNNLLEKYANNFDNIIKPKETFSNNHINDDYLENLSEYFNPKLVKKNKKKKKSRTISSISTKTVSVLSSKFNKKKKMTCKELFYHIKKCKKCQNKIGKYLNRNKIVINMDPVEVRKMLLLLIFIAT